MDVTIEHTLLILPLAFAAGVVNAAVGGGGLITVPGLFAALPDAVPAVLLGTDKASAVFGHTSAIRHYALRMTLPWRLIGLAAVAALLGSLAGATIVYAIPARIVRPAVIVLLAGMLVYTLVRPDFGSADTGAPVGRGRRAAGLAIAFSIGVYDGIFGPGTGSFLVFLFVRVFRFDFLRATACAKVVNLAADLGALLFFVPTGALIWPLAIPMGISAYVGGRVGAPLVMRGGNLWIRRIFIALSATLLVKLCWETFF